MNTVISDPVVFFPSFSTEPCFSVAESFSKFKKNVV